MNVDARRFRVLREGRRAVEDGRRFRQGRQGEAGQDLRLRTGGTTDVMAITVLSQGDRHRVEHGQLQQRRRGADGAARRPRACGRSAIRSRFMGHLKSGAVRAHRRVPRQPLRGIAGRADHEGAGHRGAELPDVARRGDAEGRARAGGALLGRRHAEGRRVAAVQGLSQGQRRLRGADTGPGLREIPGRSGDASTAIFSASRLKLVRARLLNGDVGLALLFAGLGLVWIVGSFGHPFWEGFAPQSGFLPFIYGVLLAGLWTGDPGGRLFSMTEQRAACRSRSANRSLILVALTAAAIGIDVAGFGVVDLPAAPVPVRGRRAAAACCVRSSSPARRRRP